MERGKPSSLKGLHIGLIKAVSEGEGFGRNDTGNYALMLSCRLGSGSASPGSADGDSLVFPKYSPGLLCDVSRGQA